MTEQRRDDDEHEPDDGRAGKEFDPDIHPDVEHESMTTQGSGRKFAPGVGEPETDERARQHKGSGKTFSPSVEPPEDDQEQGSGSGKQFRPGGDRH